MQIENARDVSATLMTITASEGTFRRYKKPPQIKGTKILKKAREVITGFEKGTLETRMYLESETAKAKSVQGLEGVFDESDLPTNTGADVIRYYENTDSSRTLIVSRGLKNDNKLPFDMVLRTDKGVFRRYSESVRMWRYEVEYKKARDLGFSDKDIRWHLEHVFKSGGGEDYSSQNIIDEAMEKRLRDPNFGPLPQNFDNVKDMSNFDPNVVGGNRTAGNFAVGKPGFGFIRDYKGLDILLEALSDLSPNIHLIIAGEVYGSFEKYDQIIKERELVERVHIYDQYIADEAVSKFFSAADVCVLPYKGATQSGITAISKHFELPSIVTDVGGLKENVRHNETGLVVDFPRPHLIANAIKAYYRDNLQEKFSSAIAGSKGEEGWDRFAEKIIDFARSL